MTRSECTFFKEGVSYGVLHGLKQEDIDKLYPNEGLQPLVMTGTVVEDKLGTYLNKSSTPRNRSTTIK